MEKLFVTRAGDLTIFWTSLNKFEQVWTSLYKFTKIMGVHVQRNPVTLNLDIYYEEEDDSEE